MATLTKALLKAKFETGDTPSEQDFIDLIDSTHNEGFVSEAAIVSERNEPTPGAGISLTPPGSYDVPYWKTENNGNSIRIGGTFTRTGTVSKGAKVCDLAAIGGRTTILTAWQWSSGGSPLPVALEFNPDTGAVNALADILESYLTIEQTIAPEL